jgi:SAM-dependent methyltransferase
VRSGAVVYGQFQGFNDFAGKVVLDFGCGAGGKTVYYAGRGTRRTIGVDREPDTTLAIAYARARRLAIEFRSLLPNGRIPLHDDTCDVVINSSVLEHVDDLPRAFREIRRVLKPDGLLLTRWHPFRSRHGAHLGPAIGIPFAHLLFREADLMRAYCHSLMRRFGTIPPLLGAINAESQSFADLEYHLNRVTVRQMRQAVEAAGFELRERRHLRKTRQLRLSRYVPERWIDYLIDYEVQICVNRKSPGFEGAPIPELRAGAAARSAAEETPAHAQGPV